MCLLPELRRASEIGGAGALVCEVDLVVEHERFAAAPLRHHTHNRSRTHRDPLAQGQATRVQIRDQYSGKLGTLVPPRSPVGQEDVVDRLLVWAMVDPLNY